MQSSALFDLEQILKPQTIMRNKLYLTILASIFCSLWMGATIFGMTNTVQSHAYCLTSLHSVLFLAIILSFKSSVSNYERVTLFTLGVGIALMLIDPWTTRSDKMYTQRGKNYYHSTFGIDMLLILSNFPAALYFMINKVLMRDRVVVHILMLNFITMCTFSIMAVLFEDAQLDLSDKHGLFGWLDAKICFLTIILNGFVATFWGSMGYIISMQFFPPIICMNAFLLEPCVA